MNSQTIKTKTKRNLNKTYKSQWTNGLGLLPPFIIDCITKGCLVTEDKKHRSSGWKDLLLKCALSLTYSTVTSIQRFTAKYK